MRSVKFPKMFNAASTRVWKSDEYLNATAQNIKLLLLSARGELVGDPYFGLLIKQFMFDQNNYVLRDQLIDMILTQLVIFIPQLYVERKDISVYQDPGKGTVVCKFKGTNQIDYQLNTYSLVLFKQNESSM